MSEQLDRVRGADHRAEKVEGRSVLAELRGIAYVVFALVGVVMLILGLTTKDELSGALEVLGLALASSNVLARVNLR